MTEKELPRRRFLRGEFLTSLQSSKVKTQGFQGIRPPWSVDNALFVENCTRCGDCVNVCETQIIIKGSGDFPEISFSNGECTFCDKCVDVCQQPIFRSREEAAWPHKIEIAQNCLTKSNVECRSCEDSCEMRAIRFRPMLGMTSQVSVNPDQCNGCGACIQTCPVNAIKISYPREEYNNE
ncbi:ferredoxin-type protein NapF [Cricetibacter osteomyelitidis]|nr:ferredoxin-type protein NapF [Cricetibacter osteomyelitidis]